MLTTNESSTHTGNDPFVAYEYMTVKADRDREGLSRDTYRNFGWIVEGYGSPIPGSSTVGIKLKRDRGIKNRPLIVELQRQAENALQTIDQLERSKDTVSVAAALSVGVVGSALLAGSVFTINSGHWVAGILLGTAGLLGWLAGYITHGRVKSKRTQKVAALIDRQYDIVYSTAEQAAQLSR